MNLHPGQTTCRDRGHNFVEVRIHENAVLLQLRRQLSRDLADQTSSDLPGARSKDKADCMGPALRGETRVFEAGVAADFDPHGSPSLAHGRALCGRQQHVLERCSGVSLAHQRFADEKGVKPRCPQPVHILSCLDAAFADAHGGSRQPRRRDRAILRAGPQRSSGRGY